MQGLDKANDEVIINAMETKENLEAKERETRLRL